MGRDSRREQIDALGEDALAGLLEQRVFSQQRAEVVRLITGLQDAGRLDVELAESRVHRAQVEMRESLEALSRAKETNGHEAEALLRLVQLSANEDRALDEDVRQVSIDLKNLGRGFVRPELVGNGEIQHMVERRQRVRAAGASKPEVEVV